MNPALFTNQPDTSPPGERTIWLYWENPRGRTIPPHIALCRAAMDFHCGDLDIRLVTPTNIEEYLPDLSDALGGIRNAADGKVSIAIKVAFIRAFLLEKYGGLYLDSDCIPLTSLSPILDDIHKFEFVAIRRTSAKTRHISIGLLGARQGSDIAAIYAKTLREHLSAKTTFKWGEVGAFTLTPIVDRADSPHLILPEAYAHPIVAEKQWMFMSKDIDPEDVLQAETFLIMLFHRPFTGPSKQIPQYGIPSSAEGWLHDWTIEDLYRGNILLSKLFRKSLPEQAFSEYSSTIKSLTR